MLDLCRLGRRPQSVILGRSVAAGEVTVRDHPLSLCCGRSLYKKTRTVAQALEGDRWITDISGALTVQVILDYLIVWDMTREVHLLDDRADRLCWKWTADKVFSTSSAYQSFFIGQHPVEGERLLGKVRAPSKSKFCIWLVLHDRCWIAAQRKRHGLHDDDCCALCAQSSETINHLLIECPFSRDL